MFIQPTKITLFAKQQLWKYVILNVTVNDAMIIIGAGDS